MNRLGDRAWVSITLDGIGTYSDVITQMGELSLEAEEGHLGSIGSVSLTICDVDDNLKAWFDTKPIEGRSASVSYHVNSSEEVVFKGKVVSPIEWSESERTFSLNFADRFQTEEVPPAEDWGNYPIAFGTVANSPCVREGGEYSASTIDSIYSRREGNITIQECRPRIENWEELIAANGGAGMTLKIDGALFSGNLVGGVFTALAFNACIASSGFRKRSKDSENYGNPSAVFLSNLDVNMLGLEAFVIYKSKYYYVLGKDGKTKMKVSKSTPGAEQNTDQRKFLTQVSSFGDYASVILGQPCTDDFGDATAEVGKTDWDGSIECYGKPPLNKCKPTTGGSAWEIPGGTAVRLQKPTKYICNLLPCTIVNIKENGIPIKGYLKSEAGPSYVVFPEEKSSLTCDLINTLKLKGTIEYLILNYTELDTPVWHGVTDFPVGFTLTSSADAYQVLENICVDACIGMSIHGGVPHFYDLFNLFASSALTLGNDNIEMDSIVMRTTDITDIYTRVVAKYQTPLGERTVEKKNNVDLFTLETLEHSIMIFNTKPGVERFVNYTLWRRSNLWHEVSFDCFLYALNLLPYEGVTLSGMLSGVAVCKSKSIDVDDHSVSLTLGLSSNVTNAVAPVDVMPTSLTLAELDACSPKGMPNLPSLRAKAPILGRDNKSYTAMANQNYPAKIEEILSLKKDGTETEEEGFTVFKVSIVDAGDYDELSAIATDEDGDPIPVYCLAFEAAQPDWDDVGTVSFEWVDPDEQGLEEGQPSRKAEDSSPNPDTDENSRGYQHLCPIYQVGDLITIAWQPEGTGFRDPEEDIIWFLDLNTNSRVWVNKSPWIDPEDA